MKLLLIILAMLVQQSNNGNRLTSSVDRYSWSNICAGKIDAEWYGTQEAQDIADIVIAVQKNNGGWMKNDELHKLSETDYARLLREKGEHSCLDNTATTQEMRYLARVYAATGEARFQQAFLRGLNMLLSSQKTSGGWSQYWPLTNDGTYKDYITFNDDLITNVMKILRDIYQNDDIFYNITDQAMRTRCQQAFDRGINCILACQFDDNGTLSAWCAQHDTVAPYYPMEGRPHELPSISGCESASLLNFLMTIDNPSPELCNAINAGVAWLDAHKMPNKAVEDYTNAHGEKDRRIIDKPGSDLWGRFIQLGGSNGVATYNHFFQKLQRRGKQRSYTYDGIKYTYSEFEIASSSYDTTKAYQPIFAIYKDTIAHMYYRFLYNYEDTPMSTTQDGCPIYTSLLATNRANYQYVGNWAQKTINVLYPVWLTQHPQGAAVENCSSQAPAVRKEMHNGQVVIVRNDETYDILGNKL